MAALPPINDSNTFPDKTEGGDPFTATDVVSAADLNAIKSRVSENRSQANTALADAGAAQTAADAAQVDATQALSDAADAQADATQALSDAADAQAAAGTAQTAADDAQTDATSALTLASLILDMRPVGSVNLPVGISDTYLAERLIVLVEGSDFAVGLLDNNTAGKTTFVERNYNPATYPGGDPGGDVVITPVDSDHHIDGPTRLTRVGDTMMVCLKAIAGTDYYWTTSLMRSPATPVQASHTSATRTLVPADEDSILPISAASNAVEVTIPHTLFGSIQEGHAWSTTIDCSSVAGGALTFVGSGGISITYHGKDPATAAIAAGDTIRIVVKSATVAHVTVTPAGDAAQTHIVSTSNPHSTTAAQVGADPKTTVQTAHTTATLTLADADNNQHRALNTASNSIAISIPDSLTFPFVWTARKSSASNSVTITTGAGLITPKESGTVPVTDVDAYITIFAESSTVAAVFVAVAT